MEFNLFIIPVGIWIGSSTTYYQSFVASFIFYLIFVPVVASILMKVLYRAGQFSAVSGAMFCQSFASTAYWKSSFQAS